MAELPRTPFNTSETKPIRYNLSAADIAGPYTEIARAADKASGALSDVSVPLAQEAASQVVRRDDSGNLIVDQLPPLFGDAAKQARLTIAAKLEPQIQTDLLKQKVAHQYDPVGFQNSVSAYKPALLKGMDSQLAVGVDKMIDSTSQQYLRSLIVEKDSHDTHEQLQTKQAQIKDTVEQMDLLARQGAGSMPVGSDAYKTFQTKATDLATLYDSLGNPKFGMSADRRKLELDEHYAGFKVQEVIGKAQRQYMDDQDLPKATQTLIDGMWGPNAPKNLKASQRDHGISEGLAHLRNLSAGNGEAIQQSRTATSGFVRLNLEKPGAEFPMGEWGNLRQNAENLKDKRSLDALDEFKEMYPLSKALLQASPEARASMLHDMQQGIVPMFRSQVERDASPATSLIEGKKVDLATNAYAVSQFQSLTKTLEGKVSKDADDALVRMEKNAKEGVPVLPDDIQHFAEMARRSGNEAAIEKAKPWLDALDNYQGRPAGETHEQLTGWIAAQRAKGVTAMQADMLDHLDAIAKAHDQRFTENPRREAASAGWTGDPGQLTFSGQDAATLAGRNRDNGIINQRAPSTGAISALMPEEAKQFAVLATTGNPQQVGDFLSTLKGATSPETYRATMEDKTVKDAMITAFNSNVPQRLDTIGSVLAGLWDTNSHDFESKYDKQAADRVNQWKALASVDPETRTKKLSSTESPQNQKDLADAISSETSSTTPQQVANKLGNFAQRNIIGINKGLPRDTLRGNTFAEIALKNEYVNAYQALRSVGVDPATADQMAVERLSANWQRSEMNGGRLMRNAPESAYPVNPMTQDHAYMLDHLKADISKAYGHEQIVTNEGIIPGWQIKGIISDPQSEREAAAYDKSKPVSETNQPPSYPIHIIDANGKDQVFGGTGRDGLPNRYHWDVDRMMGEGRAKVSQALKWTESMRMLKDLVPGPGELRSLSTTPVIGGGSNGGR